MFTQIYGYRGNKKCPADCVPLMAVKWITDHVISGDYLGPHRTLSSPMFYTILPSFRVPKERTEWYYYAGLIFGVPMTNLVNWILPRKKSGDLYTTCPWSSRWNQTSLSWVREGSKCSGSSSAAVFLCFRSILQNPYHFSLSNIDLILGHRRNCYGTLCLSTITIHILTHIESIISINRSPPLCFNRPYV